MKKKWATWLSLLVLCLSIVANISQGYTVLADSLASDESMLIQDDDLLVSSKVTPSQAGNAWVIHYRYHAVEDGETRRLKFQFLDPQGQPITVVPEEGWTITKDKQLLSTFRAQDEGYVRLTTESSITKISLNVQADAQDKSGKLQTDILPKDIGKTYALTPPENTVTGTSSTSTKSSSSATPSSSSSSSTASTTSKSVTNSQASQTMASTSASRSTATQFQTKMLTAGPNIVPQYTTDATGIYPTNSWIPAGNQTVINHQGNVNATNQWDGNKSWSGDPSNKSTSYIEYGGTGSAAQFAMRKYAKETATPGLYDVYLNVRGNDQKNIKPVNIVLVVDMSGSMEPDRAPAVRSGISSFLQQITNAGIGDYVNVGLVGYSSPNFLSTKTGIVKVDMKAVSAQGQVAALNGAVNQTFQGGTFTQLGIRNGTDMLQRDTSTNQKMMILLTDGVPTFSYKVTDAIQNNNVVYGTKFSTDRDEPGYTSQLWTRGRVDYPISYSAGGSTISDTWPATLGEAKISKDKGITLHALGIQLDQDNGYRKDPNNPYMTRQQVLANMNLLATLGLYQDANSSTDIQKYLQNRAQNVISAFSTVNNATISDPLGSQFQYNGTVDVKSIGTKSIVKLPTTNMTSNQLNVSDMSLGAGEEVQFHYQVRLNTETNDFKPDYWYQMNGRTKLMPNINTPDYQVDFGVPSAKAPGITLNLKKIWEEYDGIKTNRPTQVTYGITRNNTVTNNAWQKGFATIQGTSSNDTWTTSVSKLAVDATSQPSLSLPKYNTNGVAFNYSVSEEVAVNGYDGTKVDDMTYKNTKQFKPLNLQVTKTDSNGKNIAGASFKLVNSSGKEFSINTDSTGAIFTFANLTPGTYTLTETKAPDGYVILSQPIIITVDKNGSVTQDGKPISADNYTIKLTVKNQQKGILPSTGGSGRTGYFIASLIFMGLVAIIGGIFYYRNRRLRHHQLLKGPDNKIHLLLLLLITSLGITFTNAQKIAADEQPITFILHKRVFKDSGDLKTIKDNGLVITPNDPNSGVIDSDKTYGLNGVTFDVYDVTSYVSNALKSTSKEALMKHVTNTDKASLLAEIKPYQPTSQEVVTVSSDADDGVARFSVQPTSQNSAYLILEKQISDKDAGKVKMTATPMLVILPVANPVDKTSFLTTINLYPKNTAVKTPVIPPVNPVNPKPPHFPFLPDTGEVKSVMVVLGGIVVIIAVSFWYNRSKPKPS
ncbi:pilin N-terminal domain-containing protein [Lactococcus raffinolactis]|uniref:pilin N-terminal domain-containing protein n=1 Tax=Pseudolactococcus raffinolactis TaxID=1366 RepID=UPI0011087504|nr:pilin N-terminal domain-containing protein [Lactococcus raffinolactis]TLQ12835.1 VWA domain-containing protein [Lactococcus raffinolactis]